MKRRLSRRAFTLVEVLLGLLIFSIIAGGLFGTFRAGLDINRRSQKDNNGYRELRWIFEQMARDLENAVYYDFSGSYPELRPFEGASDRLHLIVVTRDGLKSVGYAISDSKDKPSQNTDLRPAGKTKLLIRTEQPLVKFFGSSTSDGEVMGHVKENGFKLSYAPEPKINITEIPWQDVWTKNSLPSAVKVELIMADGGAGNFSLTREFLMPVGISTDN